MLRRKQFKALAAALVSERDSGDHKQLDRVIELLCEILEKENPLFNAEKFKAAAGYKETLK